MAADQTKEVSAVVVTAPAAFGNASQFPDRWHLNATRLYPLLETIDAARVVLFFFKDDEFDPGGRGEQSNKALARRGLPYAIFDQPRGLTTHWAGTTGDFAERCGDWIVGFANNSVKPDEGAQCQDGEVAPNSPGAMLALQPLAGRLQR